MPHDWIVPKALEQRRHDVPIDVIEHVDEREHDERARAQLRERGWHIVRGGHADASLPCRTTEPHDADVDASIHAKMMTVPQRVAQFLTKRKPAKFCDGCIKKELDLPRPQQA